MTQGITFHGNPMTIRGTQLKVGDTVPAFKLVGTDMQDLTQDRLLGKPSIISVVPSLDTPVCQKETRRFFEEVERIGSGVALLTVSMDLPFAQKRFCAAEGMESAITASDYKYRTFGDSFGVFIEELGLLARAVFVVNSKGVIEHVEYVSEVTSEPDYDRALEALRAAK